MSTEDDKPLTRSDVERIVERVVHNHNGLNERLNQTAWRVLRMIMPLGIQITIFTISFYGLVAMIAFGGISFIPFAMSLGAPGGPATDIMVAYYAYLFLTCVCAFGVLSPIFYWTYKIVKYGFDWIMCTKEEKEHSS
ncbi:MAG: hypothetical protein ACTSUE_16665 [Promethearchaeota archaeon]